MTCENTRRSTPYSFMLCVLQVLSGSSITITNEEACKNVCRILFPVFVVYSFNNKRTYSL